VNVQPGIAGWEGARKQTVLSFVVEPCGMVAPHTHANAVEVNTVLKGGGVVAQLTTQTNEVHVSTVSEGDSFFFEQGSYHWWMNLGTEPLLTVGAFMNTDDPDVALMAFDEGAGVVGTLLDQTSLLNTMIGSSSGQKTTVELEPGQSPLFPRLTSAACAAARQQFNAKAAETEGSFQKNPADSKLFKPEELRSGTFGLSPSDTPVSCPKAPCGGGLRPLAGEVSTLSSHVSGSGQTVLPFNGGMALTSQGGGPPPAALCPGFSNVAGGKALVKFVVSYCGIVNVHTHTNAAEWNTVISGAGQVSYYQVNTGSKPQRVTMNVKKGDTFVFPRGAAHWWVNYSPMEQLVTVGGFTAAFPDTALLSQLFKQTQAIFPMVTSAVLGDAFVPSADSDSLFPLLATRSPKSCGGDQPCTSCA